MNVNSSSLPSLFSIESVDAEQLITWSKFELAVIEDVHDIRFQREERIADIFQSSRNINEKDRDWARQFRLQPLQFLEGAVFKNITLNPYDLYLPEKVVIKRLINNELEFVVVFSGFNSKDKDYFKTFVSLLNKNKIDFTEELFGNITIKGTDNVLKVLTHLVAQKQFHPYVLDIVKSQSFKESVNSFSATYSSSYFENARAKDEKLAKRKIEIEQMQKKIKVVMDGANRWPTQKDSDNVERKEERKSQEVLPSKKSNSVDETSPDVIGSKLEAHWANLAQEKGRALTESEKAWNIPASVFPESMQNWDIEQWGEYYGRD